ncbi:MAG TPA: polysaccharide lyase 6 family protein, partial [Oceanipulchritudo sp.]|nr:polysaccharide lyase 6 family protein [Oceanipulchritudo sp.]
MTGFLGLLIGLVGGAWGMEINVRTPAELETALAGVEPGTVIRMAPGEWTGLDLLIRAEGRPEAPVVLKAATPGTVRLTGETSIRLEGSHIEISGLHFHEAVVPEGREALITLRGEAGKVARNSRLTELYFERCNPEDLLRKYPWIRMYGKANRVDHSRFEGQAHRGLAIQIRVHEPAPGHRIDHNHFVDRLPGAMSNGYEIIQIGLSEDSLKPGKVIIERNIFERCDGETEIISSKSFSNLIRNNLFLHSSGSVTLRHGDKGSVIDNAFIGGNKAKTGGVRVVGEGNRVSGNSFQGLTGRTGGVIVLYCGIPDSPLNGYFPADNAILEENIFYNNSGNAVYLT